MNSIHIHLTISGPSSRHGLHFSWLKTDVAGPHSTIKLGYCSVEDIARLKFAGACKWVMVVMGFNSLKGLGDLRKDAPNFARPLREGCACRGEGAGSSAARGSAQRGIRLHFGVSSKNSTFPWGPFQEYHILSYWQRGVDFSNSSQSTESPKNRMPMSGIPFNASTLGQVVGDMSVYLQNYPQKGLVLKPRQRWWLATVFSNHRRSLETDPCGKGGDSDASP